MELRAHADRCTSLPEEVVLMGMDGDEGGGDLMIEVRGRSLQLRCARHRRAAALAARRSNGQQEISQLA